MSAEKSYSSSGEDSDVGTPKKKRKYEHKFQEKWEHDRRFSSWICKSKNSNKAFCNVCNCELAGSVTLLERHSKTEKHMKNLESRDKSQRMTSFFQRSVSSFEKQVAASELKLCAFVAEHNLPIAIMDHLPGLLANAAPDSKIAKSVKCARTKATSHFKQLIGPSYFDDLIFHLKRIMFSLIIDESTDLSTTKHLVLICRFYDVDIQRTQDKFLCLMEVEDCTARGIFTSLVNFFDKHGIPVRNLIGFASDNASVMMGGRSGVQALLKERVPALFVQGCVCHSMHLCASNACKELPHRIEELARNVYSYIMNSPKRLSEYAEFQIFTETQPHKILHPSCTRWLSLEEVVRRILEQWPALTLYFTTAALEDGMAVASSVLQELHNPVTKMFFAFLAFILPAVNKVNVEFQATSFRVHKLRKSINSSAKAILSYFMKRESLKDKDLREINLNDPSNYLKIEDIYRGAKVESIALESSSNISKKELHDFQVKTLNFYVTLSKQMFQRFLSSGMFDKLQLLEALDPENVREGKPKSVIPLAVKFPNIIEEQDYEELNSEWRELILFEIPSLRESSMEPEQFWFTVSKEKCADELRFPKVSKLMMNLMSLPHSSAAAERIFSLVSNIKTKHRSRLKTSTLNSLLHSKALLQDENCKTWQPSAQLLKKTTATKSTPEMREEEELQF